LHHSNYTDKLEASKDFAIKDDIIYIAKVLVGEDDYIDFFKDNYEVDLTKAIRTKTRNLIALSEFNPKDFYNECRGFKYKYEIHSVYRIHIDDLRGLSETRRDIVNNKLKDKVIDINALFGLYKRDMVLNKYRIFGAYTTIMESLMGNMNIIELATTMKHVENINTTSIPNGVNVINIDAKDINEVNSRYLKQIDDKDEVIENIVDSIDYLKYLTLKEGLKWN
jgi:hypothetical protein